MKDEIILYNDEGLVVSNKKDATKFELIIYNKLGDVDSIKFGSITGTSEWKSEKELPKQNMTLDGFSTTKDLDRQLETILKSIEPEVMAAIKKVKI